MKFNIKFSDRYIASVFAVLLPALLLTANCGYFRQIEYIKFRKVHTLAGVAGEFGEPFGVAALDDKIYVSDGERGRIVRLSKDGKTETLTDKLDTPSQIAFDRQGDLIVADSGTHTIKKILKDGRVETVAGVTDKKGFADGAAGAALFNAPVGVAVFEEKIYVADTYNDRIRLIENGKVTTLAGGVRGFADGRGAKFDTPTGLAVRTDGNLLVADSLNRRIRVVEPDGNVWTLAGNGNENWTDGHLSAAEFVRPTALTTDQYGAVYVADGNAIRVIGRRFLPVVETISNSEQGFADGRLKRARFNRPSGLAFDPDGNLLVADAENQLLRVFTDSNAGKFLEIREFTKLQTTAEKFRESGEPRWPYDPPENTREIAGTLGEIRGELKSERSPAWFHNGLDIVGGYGETARFIRDEKVLRPDAVENFQTTRELLRMPTLGYIHIRLGRDAEQKPFADERFQFSFDDEDKPSDVRIPRGTKFKAGEAIGTLNTLNHVHLVAGRSGRELNALAALKLPGVTDSRPPVIEKVTLYDKNRREFETPDKGERIKPVGQIRIVVEAYDQMDGNAARRKLGLYKIGYQLFDSEQKPLNDFPKPKWTIGFAETPGNEAVKLVYATGSKSGATGETIFRYIATNEVSGRTMRESFLDAGKLPPGIYILRVFVADFFGNTTSEDIQFEII
jgi:DNA-binding beta-propeller fold protein YncE